MWVVRSLRGIQSLYSSLPDFLRIVIFRSVISWMILSVALPVATYWYAQSYGARLPIEGVPFSSLLWVCLSVVISMISALSYLVSMLLRSLFRPVSRAPKEILTAEDVENFARQRPKFAWLIRGLGLGDRRIFAALMAVLGIGFAAFGLVIMFLSGRHLSADTWMVGVQVITFTAIFQIGFGVVTELFPRQMERVADLFSAGVYIVGLGGIVVGLFTSPFEDALRAAHYGGGSKVSIRMVDHRALDDVYLFLTSKDSTTVWDDTGKVFIEIQTNKIVQIEYSKDGEWKLPEQNSRMDMQLFLPRPD